MRKNLVAYLVALFLLAGALFFFNRAYRELNLYSELANRHHTVLNNFQLLSKQINNAAILTPGLLSADAAVKNENLFFSDSVSIIKQANSLKRVVKDSANVRISQLLDTLIRSELSWILNSNVPDSIIHHQGENHIQVFRRINTLLNNGVERANFLINYRQNQLNSEIKKVRLWMFAFIALTLLLVVYTVINLFKQQSKTKKKEKELATTMNRISDGVVSVDNNWRYTFLNDAAMATHPLGLKETLGKVIWDVHPEMKGTMFWDKYHEAMITKQVIEIENYYPPMDIWFSVKVYPSEDGLTIFFKDVTENKKAEKQQALFTAIVNSSDDAIVSKTLDGIVTSWNKGAERIFGYRAGEVIGKHISLIIPGDLRHEEKKIIEKISKGVSVEHFETRRLKKDGSEIQVSLTISPIEDADHNVIGASKIVQDISERKSIEEQLISSLKETEDYRFALDESSIVAITDQKGIIKYVNNNFCKISKYHQEELIGQDHRIINSGFHPKEYIKNLWTTIANGKIWKGELKNKAKDGTIYWVDTTIVPFLNEEGKPYQYVAIRADITVRKEAEENLIKSEKVYKTIASSIPGSVICLLDADYRYLLIEGDMLEKLGYSKNKLLGNKAEDVLDPAVFARALPRFKNALEGRSDTIEYNIAGYDIVSRYVPLKDYNDKVYAIMTVAIDITKLKDAQRNITELNHGLEEKIALRTKELKKSNEEMEAFSYSVSHDLRSPLRSIIGYSTILEEDYADKLDNEAKRLTGIIKNSTLRMGQLIDDLLAFSRTGKQSLSKSPIDTTALVNDVKEELILNKNNTGLQWKIHPLPIINADLNTIRQVWINLLSNAIKYSSNVEQPIIEIGSTENHEMVTFYVKDNGVGFDEAYKDKLFKVFQRLHDPEEFEGTGVGLALVDKIISKHEGTVWAEGKEDEGATFYFSLPIK